MSKSPLFGISHIVGLMPHAKLAALQIAAFHNSHTGQCNPSDARVAAESGLSISQVRSGVSDAIKAGVIAKASDGSYSFPTVERIEANPVPANFWPREETIKALCASYPNHHFSMEEAVNDFIGYAKRNSLVFADHDAAFRSTTSALLDRREPGEVSFVLASPRGQAASTRSILAGL